MSIGGEASSPQFWSDYSISELDCTRGTELMLTLYNYGQRPLYSGSRLAPDG